MKNGVVYILLAVGLNGCQRGAPTTVPANWWKVCQQVNKGVEHYIWLHGKAPTDFDQIKSILDGSGSADLPTAGQNVSWTITPIAGDPAYGRIVCTLTDRKTGLNKNFASQIVIVPREKVWKVHYYWEKGKEVYPPVDDNLADTYAELILLAKDQLGRWPTSDEELTTQPMRGDLFGAAGHKRFKFQVLKPKDKEEQIVVKDTATGKTWIYSSIGPSVAPAVIQPGSKS
jgi:hypothetical protein